MGWIIGILGLAVVWRLVKYRLAKGAVPCPRCKGSGYLTFGDADDEICKRCKGTGQLSQRS